jgi:uncharacterized protein YeaO (DUF488 family)
MSGVLLIKIKRIYDRYDISDGTAVLVDRLWPRGVRKTTPNVEIWLKEIGPSDELRKWWGHEPNHWKGFVLRYTKELKTNKAVRKLVDIIGAHGTVTLMYATSDRQHNNAVVLKDYIKANMKRIRNEMRNGD